MKRLLFPVLAGLALLAGCTDEPTPLGPNTPAHPAYTAFAATAWTATGNATVTVVSDGTAGDAVVSYVADPVISGSLWTFTTTAAQTGTVTLPWSYSGNHPAGAVELYAVVNGVVVATLVPTDYPDGAFSYNGTFAFNVNAGDTYGFESSGGADSEMSGTFTVHVPQPPQGPAWTASGDATVTLVSDGTAGDAVMSYARSWYDGTWTFTTTAAQTGTVTVDWSYSGNHPIGLTFVLAVVNNVPVSILVGDLPSYYGPFSFSGTFTFNVNAGDTYGFQFGGQSNDETMSGTFTVHVVPQQNAAPVLAPIASLQSALEATPFSFTASATDADAGQALTFSVIGAPAGASIDPVTGVFSWTPVDDNPSGTAYDDYPVTVRVTDDAGAFDEQTVTVRVFNDDPGSLVLTGPTGPLGLSGGSATAHFSVTFADVGTADPHTVEADCGNSTVASGPALAPGVLSGTVDCTYTAAGVYTVFVTVSDDDAGFDTQVFPYVVVYDTDAGFVTGSGWITSPAGAYAANPALTGRANFGFISKYHHGATVPDGQTRFDFQAAGFTFRSTAYEWMVVSGARAQYKGTGTVNGSGSYSFLLTVIDGQQPGGGGVDRFRLKVWGPDGVIYDNQMGDWDGAEASTALGGGNIVIHPN